MRPQNFSTAGVGPEIIVKALSHPIPERLREMLVQEGTEEQLMGMARRFLLTMGLPLPEDLARLS